MTSPRRCPVGAVALAVLAATALGQQGPTFTVSATGIPAGFSSTTSSACGGLTIPSLTGIVGSEPVFLTLTSTPTAVTPTPLVLRRVALVLGIEDCSGTLSWGPFPVPIDYGAALQPTFLIDSFTDPLDPLFGPPLAGPSTIQYTLDTSWLLPAPALPLRLVVMGVTEDLPGGSGALVVSNPLEIVLIDPAAGFAPTLANVTAPQGPCDQAVPAPSGPETGGTAITITGTGFPVQSDWLQYPPEVTVGGLPATGVALLAPTVVTAVTPQLPASCPPATSAGPKDVTFANNAVVSPGGAPLAAPVQFTYCSGRTPAVESFGPPQALPEGGDPLVIMGWDFLYGARVVMTQVGSGLEATLMPPDPAITGSGPCTPQTATAISLTSPPFCTGPVSVRVVNPDGVTSAAETLVYDAIEPAVTGVTPVATIAGLSGSLSFPAMDQTGASITIDGAGFIGQASPLFGAPTVPQGPGSIFPTRTEIRDAPGGAILFSGTGTVTQDSITVSPGGTTQLGPFRPQLGLKVLQVVNPPCVSDGPAANASAPVTILVRDPLPPTIMGAEPNVLVQALPGIPGTIRIDGGNFFARRVPQTLPVTQAYPPGVPELDDIEVPAVSFGGIFSPHVTLVAQNQLIARVPEGLSVPSTIPLTVFNPDGRSATATAMLNVVPRLTNPSSANPRLDATTLLAATSLNPQINPFITDLRLFFAPNPTPTDDRLKDIANGGDPAVTGNPSAYDGMFVFNTRTTFGGMRFFDFNGIDVPSTFVLPAPITIGPLTITAGLKRVIFKAAAYEVVGTGGTLSLRFYVDQNFPLVVRSHGDFRFGGILDLAGDGLVNQGVANSPTLKFQYRCEWQLPPAGGGLGGRGGLHYVNNLVDLGSPPANPLRILPPLASSLSQPSLGTSASTLTAHSGFAPQERAAVTPEPPTAGRYGIGRAPFGGKGGGGAGGGHAGGGQGGDAGATSPAAPISAPWGNWSNLSPTTTGIPPLDEYVYGSTTAASDFAGPLGAGQTLFPYGLFAGGSGGGGGGGSLALVVPCVSIGGRGGNGGGAAVLLADGTFQLGAFGRIHADGEPGMLGIDAFPFANGEPLFVLCAPGSGGGGSGGTIFIAAVADADLTVPAWGIGQRLISADGGAGGAPTGTPSVGTANGGSGAGGRIRIAINARSSKVGLRQAQLSSRIANGNVTPSPGAPIIAQPDYCRYPSP